MTDELGQLDLYEYFSVSREPRCATLVVPQKRLITLRLPTPGGSGVDVTEQDGDWYLSIPDGSYQFTGKSSMWRIRRCRYPQRR